MFFLFADCLMGVIIIKVMSFTAFYSRFAERGFDRERLARAYDFAQNALAGMRRFSGEQYFSHPVAVAELLADFSPTEKMILGALLHDVLKNPSLTLKDLEMHFGLEIAETVARLWELKKVYLHSDLQFERQVDNLRKMFLALSGDPEVALIRLADRLHNMRTLDYVAEEKRRRIAFETMHIYAPIAARFGVYSFKNELEDLSFRYLLNKDFLFVQEQLAGYEHEREEHIAFAQAKVEELLAKEGIKALVTGRAKSVYSIYTKMKRKNRSLLKEINDLFALRIVVEDGKAEDGDPNHQMAQASAECYRVLGLIHFACVPVRDRFKDYIALPKPNGYRSLHTTVMGLSPFRQNLPTEVQIRNETMHCEAEYGIAAHWRYAENRKGDLAKAVHWARRETDKPLAILNRDSAEKGFDFYRDSIYVLTPAGEALDLPAGATPIDFAYNLKTELGHCLSEVRVNGAVVAYDHELRNGDVVEIITKGVESPNRNWLQFVKSVAAREALQAWFGAKKPSNHLRIGLEQCNAELARRSLSPLDENYRLISYYQRLAGDSLSRREAILEAVGKGDLKAMEVVEAALTLSADRESRRIGDKTNKRKRKTPVTGEGGLEIAIDGEKNISYRLARCCSVTAVTPIIGYVTRGRGISIHRQDCSILKNMDKTRLLPALVLDSARARE